MLLKRGFYFGCVLLLTVCLLEIPLLQHFVYGATNPTVAEYSGLTSGSMPWDITPGLDGNLWFTEAEASTNKIGRITPSGAITEWSLPTAGSSPRGICAGPDGNLWFTELQSDKIGRITTSGVINEWSLPTASGPYDICPGSDGNLWFTESYGDKIGRITTSGVITEYNTGLTQYCEPHGICSGEDGNIWFTEWNKDKIGRITTSGVITEWDLPGEEGDQSAPATICRGPDGKLWFTECYGNKIGRITTSGVITEWSLPNVNCRPQGICVGLDTNLWFVEEGFKDPFTGVDNGNKIGRITTSGVITEYGGITAESYPLNICNGLDGNLWFTEWYANRIGRATVGPATTDSTFRPNPDGFKFENYGQTCSWNAFKKAFNAIPIYDGDPFYWDYYEKHIKNLGSPGVCFGMSAKSLELFPSSSYAYSLDLTDSLREQIMVLHVRQAGELAQEEWVNEKEIGAGYLPGGYPGRALQRVRDSISSGFNDPIALGIFSPNKKSGHEIVPYRIEETSTYAKVFVYDPNYPGDDGRYVYFDKNNNYAWTYTFHDSTGWLDPEIVWSGTSKENKIDTVLLSTIEKPVLLMASGSLKFFASSDTIEVGITDMSGNKLGYFDGQYYDEIPQATMMPYRGEITSSYPPQFYFQQAQNINVTLSGDATDDGGMMMSAGGIGYSSAGLDFADGKRYELNVNPGSDLVGFNFSSSDPAWDMALYDIDGGKKCEFANTQAVAGEQSTFSSSDNGNTFTYKNSGSDKTFNLNLEANGETFSKSSLPVQAGATDTVQVSDWSDLADSKIALKIDNDSDGTTDSEVVLQEAPSTFYFAEGYTGQDSFTEYLCLMNPTTSATTAYITYMFADGTTQNQDVPIGATSRATVNVNDQVGPDKNVSVKITCAAPIVAERPMYFNYSGAWTGGHDVIGATSPQKSFYFAEGYTGADAFDEWLCLMNPNTKATKAYITYMFADGTTQNQTVDIGKTTRSTVKVNDIVGPDRDVSVKITSDDPIIAERPMYFAYNGAWTGGHDVIGATAPQKSFYFAEGYTGAGAFDEWLCLMNPGTSATTAHITYMFSDGSTQNQDVNIGATARATIKVNDQVGPDKDVSVKITSDDPIVAERPMYFNYNGAWTGEHDVIGATTPQSTFYFAEGYTGADSFNEYLCLMNPGTSAATAHITYMFADGSTQNQDVPIGATSRATVNVNDQVGLDRDVSVKITSDAPIVAERPMYFNYSGAWTGGHDVVGYTP